MSIEKRYSLACETGKMLKYGSYLWKGCIHFNWKKNAIIISPHEGKDSLSEHKTIRVVWKDYSVWHNSDWKDIKLGKCSGVYVG